MVLVSERGYGKKSFLFGTSLNAQMCYYSKSSWCFVQWPLVSVGVIRCLPQLLFLPCCSYQYGNVWNLTTESSK